MISHKQALMQKNAAKEPPPYDPTDHTLVKMDINGVPAMVFGNGGTEPISKDEDFRLEEDSMTAKLSDPWKKMYTNSKGKTPKATSENVGPITSWALASALGAGAGGLLGAYVGHEMGDQKLGTGLGLAAGFSLATLAAAIIACKIAAKGYRTPEEQDAYKESGTLADYLVPGIADGNRERSKQTYLTASYSEPKIWNLVGKDPKWNNEKLDAAEASDDPKVQEDYWKFMLPLGLAATAEGDKRDRIISDRFFRHYGYA